jgi:hypothetical protein
MSCSSESRNAHKLSCSGVSQALTLPDQADGQPSPAVQEEIQAVPTEVGATAAVTEEGVALPATAESVGLAGSGVAAESVSTEEGGPIPDSCVPPAAARVACVKCMRTFVSARNLRDHMNIVHADYTGELGRSVFFKKFTGGNIDAVFLPVLYVQKLKELTAYY